MAVTTRSMDSPAGSPGFLLDLLFYPGDGGDIFLRNVGTSSNYTSNPTLYTRDLQIFLLLYLFDDGHWSSRMKTGLRSFPDSFTPR
jgi:hypothetical protein